MIKECKEPSKKLSEWSRGCAPRCLKTQAEIECFIVLLFGLHHVMRCYFMLNYLNRLLPNSQKLDDLHFNISVLSRVKNNPTFLTLRPYFTSSSTMVRPNADTSPTFCFSDIYFYLCGR